ncbi:MAG: hypothetical protein IJT78_00045 [Oscillospiraceae bacterium]|nr:hypothetical protein [Oscillospiraceae bacterium]
MPSIKYVARVLSGVRWGKMSQMLETVRRKSGHGKARTFFDMGWCALRYGAGYYDYVMFGFYQMNGKQRDTYLTRMRNKKVQDLMNPPDATDEFDDKLVFNRLFASYLRRRTLDGSTATREEFAAFMDGQDAIFAKINHGDCGRGVEKLCRKDFAGVDAMYDYIKAHDLVVLEHVLPQHEEMARLHPQSVNCMRIVTDRVDDQVHIAYISVKMGRGEGVCDNSGQGGVLCRVDPDSGRIVSDASDDYFNVYDRHPDTGIVFKGYQLPMVPEAIAMVKEAALVVPSVRHVGWDVAITPEGPALIEGNDFPGTDLCQLVPFCPDKTGLWPYYKKILGLKK